MSVGEDFVGGNKTTLNIDLGAIDDLVKRLGKATKTEDQISLISQLLTQTTYWVRTSVAENRQHNQQVTETLSHVLDAIQTTSKHVENLDKSLQLDKKLQEMRSLLGSR